MQANVNKERKVIAGMFNNIASSYDFINHILSFGIDKIWRYRLVCKILKNTPKNALDIACGTGDISIALMKKGLDVTGLDIAQEMLEIAKQKSKKKYNKLLNREKKRKSLKIEPIKYILASADSIPFPSNNFDLVTIGFGIRNFENRKQSLTEIKRVLKIGGELAILEFATPRNPIWRALYNFYFLTILPFLGRVISKDKDAYNYLPSSVNTFPQYNEFKKEIEESGFSDVEFYSLTGGVAILYIAKNIIKGD